MDSLLLFDIDGTLIRTNGLGMRAMFQTASRIFGEHFKWDGIQAAGHLDPLLYAEATQLNQVEDAHVHHDRFHADYLIELKQELERSRHLCCAPPGVHELLTTLRQRRDAQGDVVLGLVTGNYTGAAPVKLATVDIDAAWFTINAFGDEAPSRPQLVALAMQKYQRAHGRAIEPRRVIVIGDTPRDIACAKANDCVAFGVATGGHSTEQLRDAGADVVVDDLRDPQPLLELLD